MTGERKVNDDARLIADSWERCERQHNLIRETSNPILRLQSAEVAHRFGRNGRAHRRTAGHFPANWPPRPQRPGTFWP